MKKIMLLVSAFAGLFLAASCQQENLEPVMSGTTVTYTVQVPDALATKTTIGDDVSNVNKLHYEVYRTSAPNTTTFTDVDRLLYHKEADVTNGIAKIEVELVNDQNFTVLFWAQVEKEGFNSPYVVTDLTKVRIKTDAELNLGAANEADYAAFSGVDFIKSTDQLVTKTVELTRPVAQLNIGTTEKSLEAFNTPIEIEGSSVTVTGLSETFDVAKQAASGEYTATYKYTETEAPYEMLVVNDKGYKYVGMNYVGFADKEDNTLITVSYVINTTEGNIDNTIENVPVKPNYRTNIIGNLITSKTEYVIELDKTWESAYVGPEFVQIPAYNAETKTWTITNADELAWVAASVNGTIGLNTKAAANCKTFKGETVLLANDIDLENNPWAPIGFVPGTSDYDYLFAGTFDGNGKTIRNLYVDNADCAGLFGKMCGATVKNLTIDGFTLKADHYAGAIVGWAEQGGSPIVVEGCKVLNGNISVAAIEIANGKHDLGDKAGAIAGYAHHGKYIRNEAKNVIINGYRDLGGIIGYGNNSVVTNNTIENITLVQNLEFDYKKDEEGKETPTTLANYIGREAGTCTNENNTGTVNKYTGPADGVAIVAYGTDENGNEIPVTYTVSSSNGFEWVSESVDNGNNFKNVTIELLTDIDLYQKNDNGEPISFNPIGSYRKEKVFSGTFDGKGHTIKNLNQNTWELNNGYYYDDLGLGLFGCVEDATIKNLVIDTANISGESAICGVVAATAYGDCIFENITVKNAKCADYQYYAGGIVGWASGNHQYVNCNLDASTIIAAQWGDFDNSTGGVIGGAGGSATILLKDCTVACRLDVFNDVTSTYQWYAYRRCGMLIGNTGKTDTNESGSTVAVAPQLTCENVIVNYGDWMNYTYCKFAGTSWPWVRTQAGISNSAYSNPRYGHPTDANGNTVVDDNHAHNEGEGHHVWLPFDQLYGGGQGVYGTKTHEGVTVNYPESFYRFQGYKDVDNTYTIYSGEGFKTIATQVLSDASKSVTIELANDIDLAGIEWPAVCAKAAFVLDGKGKSIKNLTTTAVEDHGFYSTAMFTSTRKAAIIKNVVVENATVTGNGRDNSHGAVLVSSNYSSLNIEGVTVKNSTVSNCDRSAIIATYLYFTDATVKNCVVDGCTVNSIGTAGAILGMNNSHNFEATGNTVKNTTVSSSEGSNKAGILIGTWQNAGTLTESNNVVENSKAINAGTETNNNIGRHA